MTTWTARAGSWNEEDTPPVMETPSSLPELIIDGRPVTVGDTTHVGVLWTGEEGEAGLYKSEDGSLIQIFKR